MLSNLWNIFTFIIIFLTDTNCRYTSIFFSCFSIWIVRLWHFDIISSILDTTQVFPGKSYHFQTCGVPGGGVGNIPHSFMHGNNAKAPSKMPIEVDHPPRVLCTCGIIPVSPGLQLKFSWSSHHPGPQTDFPLMAYSCHPPIKPNFFLMW